MADGWVVIAAIPQQYRGDSALDRVARIAVGLGYRLNEVDLGVMFDADNEMWITLSVEDETPRLSPFGIFVRATMGGAVLSDDPDDLDGAPEALSQVSPTVETPALPPHRPQAKQPLPFSCEECQRGFVTERGMKTHRTLVHDRPPEPAVPVPPTDADFVCGDCNRGFASEHGLSVHQGTAHRSKDYPASYWRRGDPFLACSECDWYTNTVVTLMLHASRQHDREPTDSERIPLTDDARAERLAKAAS